MHVFSDLESLRIAVEMERRGELFYRRAARVSKSPETIAILNLLAQDEQNHRAEFERLLANESSALTWDSYDNETNAYLSAIAAEVVFPNGLMTLKEDGFENPSAILRHAIASEKDSIMFYTELRRLTNDEHACDVFAEIVRQERGHLNRLQRQLNQIAQQPDRRI